VCALHARDGPGMRHLFALLSAAFCVLAGIVLLDIKPVQENNMFGAIAHGLGLYCIGKGLYCLADLWRDGGGQARPALMPSVLPTAALPASMPVAPRPPGFIQKHPRLVWGLLAFLAVAGVIASIIGNRVSKTRSDAAYREYLREKEEWNKAHPKGTY
jgi:hypothetical protein